jgi:hypothetical protein
MTIEERAKIVRRMEEISEQHELSACEISHCELCGEYYNLLQKTYEEIERGKTAERAAD